MTLILYLLVSMHVSLYFEYILTDLDQIRCKKSLRNSVQQLKLTFKIDDVKANALFKGAN